jgi:hypothetical protein
MDAVENLKRGSFFTAEKPLEIFRNPETGQVVLAWYSTFHIPDGPTIDTPMGVVLTREAAQKLLVDLPHLQFLLEEATKGPTKPDFVQ